MKSNFNFKEDNNQQKVMQIQEEKGSFFRPKWEIKAKGQPHPARRWCHTATIHNNYLYLMGGRLAESAKLKQFAYRINCQTFQCEPIQLSDNPMTRQSHSCSLINDSLYVLFGISKSSKVLNDCLQLKIAQNSLIWQKKQQKPQIDSRESHMSLVLEERYILIYGGTDSQQKLIQDFYIYDVERQTWKKIQKITGAVQVKVGGTLINIKNQIYLFGGQINDQNQYSNQIYKIQIKNYHQNDPALQTQISIQKLDVKGPKPIPRSQYASVSYKDRYLIILGGEGPIKEKNEFPTLLGDIWAFDTQKMSWEEIIPENQSIFKPRSSFTASVYKDSLIVFGGLIGFKDFRSTDQMFVLTLNTQIQKRPICNLCKSSYKSVPKQQIQIQKTKAQLNNRHFSTSFSTIFAISQTIQNSFTALVTLLHSFDPFQIQKCSIALNEQVLQIGVKNIILSESQWNHLLNSYEFFPLIQQKDERIKKALKHQIEYNNLNYLSYNIKNSCFRLGNEFLISWINEKKQLEICLMNKFGIYRTLNLNSEISVHPSHTSIILQYLKQYNINITSLFQNQLTIIVTSLKNNKSINYVKQIVFDAKENDILMEGQLMFKDYIQKAFSKKLSFGVAISNKNAIFSQNQKQTQLKSKQIEKWPQENNFADLFDNIFTYQCIGQSQILLYQNNKLMHRNQIKKSQNIVFQFHLTQKIQPNITFSDLTPTNQLINAIKLTIEEISNPKLKAVKRQMSLYRQQNINTNSPNKDQHWKYPSKAVKTNETQNNDNSMEIELLDKEDKK